MTSERQRLWLRGGAVLVIGFGLLIGLGAAPATGGPVVLLADLLIWPMDGAERGLLPETRLLFVIAGGVMAGWGWMLWIVAGTLLETMPALARRMILGPVLLWFDLDSAGSLAAEVPLNVAGNLVFLTLFSLSFLMGRSPGPA